MSAKKHKFDGLHFWKLIQQIQENYLQFWSVGSAGYKNTVLYSGTVSEPEELTLGEKAVIRSWKKCTKFLREGIN